MSAREGFDQRKATDTYVRTLTNASAAVDAIQATRDELAAKVGRDERWTFIRFDGPRGMGNFHMRLPTHYLLSTTEAMLKQAKKRLETVAAINPLPTKL